MPGKPVPSDKTAKRIASLYEAVAERISDEVKVAVLSGNLTRADYLRERRAAIEALLKAAEAQAAAGTAIEIRNSYAKAGELATTILREAGAKELKATFNKADEQRLALLIENATVKFNDITQFVGRRTDDVFRQISLEQVTAGNSLTRKELSANLEQALQRVGVANQGPGTYRWINVGGRNFQLSNYAEMVARTTPREAASRAMVSRILDNGRDLVTISSHSSSCDICAEYDGKTFSLSGNSTEFGELMELPPFHPNCGHVLTPAAIF
jgi:hypothetical protein